MEETAFDKKIHHDLEMSTGLNVLSVSTNYVDSIRMLDHHLEMIYGKKINREIIYKDYIESNKRILSVEDIQEISQTELRNILRKEEDFESKIIRLREISSLINIDEYQIENVNDKLVQEAIELIGLKGNVDSLIGEIIENNSFFVDKPKNFKDLSSALLMIINDVVKIYSSGMQLSFPSTKMTAMTQTKGRCYFRGENGFYNISKASCYRGKPWSEINDPLFDKILWELRLNECFKFFNCFDVVKNWNYSDINWLAIAQHYGFRTPMLDLTTNFKTALFFACCKPDKNGLDWLPLTSADFKKVDSRKDIANLGGDSRFAVIHYVPTNIVDCQWLLADEKEARRIITPIGYQPFMRCSTQYGYMMMTDYDYDLMKDSLFKKIKINLSEELCNWIYEEMNCGKNIYPNDDDIARIKEITEIVKNMNKRKVFSTEVVEFVKKEVEDMIFNDSNDEINPEIFYKTLRKNGVKIKNEIEVMSTKNIDRVNRRYKVENVESKIEMPKCSPMFYL